MAGGRRRRRSSASSSINSAPPLQPQAAAEGAGHSTHAASTASLPQLPFDDPFAYNSDLETLSSVSSHSSLDQEQEPEPDREPQESDEPPEPPTAAARDESPASDDEARRSAALAELTSIEVEFAQLRERLYSERLAQVQIEEARLAAGQHGEYARAAAALAQAHGERLERLQRAHAAWAAQRQRQHDAWVRAVDYTHCVRRQELRRRLAGAQQRRLWRLRDSRARVEAAPADDALQISRARRMADAARRCLVHARRVPLAAAGLSDAEKDADYGAMHLPVLPRAPKPGFRRVFVPPLAAEPVRKRKPRQPRKPRVNQIAMLPPVAEDNPPDIRAPQGLKV